MDSVSRAIGAVQLADEVVQKQWFELVCQTYDQLVQSGPPDWNQFAAALTEAASAGVGRQVAEQFVEYMAANDLVPIETVRQMRELGSELDVLYRQHATNLVAGGEVATDGYDEQRWNAFLGEHGAHWNGDESSWEQFKAWFLYHAEERKLAVPGNGFVTYVEGQPDKVAAFAQYGFSIAAQAGAADGHTAAVDVSTFPELKPGDSGEWVAYLDAMLASNGF